MSDDYDITWYAGNLLEKAEEAIEGTELGEEDCFRAQAFALTSIAQSLLTLTRHIIDKEGK